MRVRMEANGALVGMIITVEIAYVVEGSRLANCGWTGLELKLSGY